MTDGVLLLVLPVVGVVCGGIGWPIVREQVRLQAEREALREGVSGHPSFTRPDSEPGATPTEPGIREPDLAPSLSDLDCGYVSVVGDTLITRHGLECNGRDPWSAQGFVTTAEEIGAL